MNSIQFLSTRNGLDKIDTKQVGITVLPFGFMPGCGSTDVIFNLRTARGETMSQKDGFVFHLCILE